MVSLEQRSRPQKITTLPKVQSLTKDLSRLFFSSILEVDFQVDLKFQKKRDTNLKSESMWSQRLLSKTKRKMILQLIKMKF